MRVARKALPLLFLGAFLFAACGDDDDGTGPDGVTVADLAGSWTATQLQFTAADGSASVDLINDLGGSFVLQIQSDGSFTADVSVPGQDPFQLPGSVTISGSTLTVDFAQDVPPFNDFDASFTLSGSQLTLDVSDASFDFNQDGVEDPATATVIFQRQ